MNPSGGVVPIRMADSAPACESCVVVGSGLPPNFVDWSVRDPETVGNGYDPWYGREGRKSWWWFLTGVRGSPLGSHPHTVCLPSSWCVPRPPGWGPVLKSSPRVRPEWTRSSPRGEGGRRGQIRRPVGPPTLHRKGFASTHTCVTPEVPWRVTTVSLPDLPRRRRTRRHAPHPPSLSL